MAEQSYGHLRSVSATATINLANGTEAYTHPMFSSFRVVAITCVIKTAVSDDGVVTVYRATRPDSLTSAVTIGTFTVPVLASGEGTVYKCNVWSVSDTTLAPGEQIAFDPSSDGVGVVYCGALGYEFEEPPTAYDNTSATLFASIAKPHSGLGYVRQLVFTES